MTAALIIGVVVVLVLIGMTVGWILRAVQPRPDDDLAPQGNHPGAYLAWRLRHRRCPKTPDGRHDWVYEHKTTHDRRCHACEAKE